MGKPSARSSSFRARSSTSLSDLRLGALVLMLWAVMPLAGCGFSPLYEGESGARTVNALADIDISAPETTLGRALKYNLLDKVTDSGYAPASAAYRLVLSPRSQTQDVAIQQDAAVTRANYILVVPFILIDNATGKTILKSTSRSRSSYNRVESEFANLTAAQDAERRTAEAAAEDIKRQVGVFFDRQTTLSTADAAGR